MSYTYYTISFIHIYIYAYYMTHVICMHIAKYMSFFRSYIESNLFLCRSRLGCGVHSSRSLPNFWNNKSLMHVSLHRFMSIPYAIHLSGHNICIIIMVANCQSVAEFVSQYVANNGSLHHSSGGVLTRIFHDSFGALARSLRKSVQDANQSQPGMIRGCPL